MSHRWERMVERFAEQERYCLGSDILYREDVAKLLARQQARVVRMVKKACPHGPDFNGGMIPCEQGEWINVNDILAALRADGKEKK